MWHLMDIQSNILADVYSDILADACSGLLSGILSKNWFDILSGFDCVLSLPDILSGIWSGILCDNWTDILCGIPSASSDILCLILSGFLSDMFEGHGQSDILTEMYSDLFRCSIGILADNFLAIIPTFYLPFFWHFLSGIKSVIDLTFYCHSSWHLIGHLMFYQAAFLALTYLMFYFAFFPAFVLAFYQAFYQAFFLAFWSVYLACMHSDTFRHFSWCILW